MSDRIVVTMGDENFRPITELTFPAAQEYARKIGADFHIITERRRPDVNICYEKFQMRDLLETHERILYVDGDVLIRKTAPDVFPEVPPGYFSAVDEGSKYIDFWNHETIREQYAPYGWTVPWSGSHFNAGVMVFDRSHKKLFENPIVTNLRYWDQPCLNVAVERMGIPYHPLPQEFNFMPFHRYIQLGDRPQRAHFVHYAGTTMGPAEKSAYIRRDLGIQ